jgi:hypothetical protein
MHSTHGDFRRDHGEIRQTGVLVRQVLWITLGVVSVVASS